MKILNKIFTITFFIVYSQTIFCQTNVQIDERFELTSIAFRLSDFNVYSQPMPKNYVNDIKTYFDKYKNHDLIKFIKHIVESKKPFNIAFVATSAASIEINNNNISFSKKWITCYDLAPQKDTTGQEWTKNELDEYIRLLNKFYKDTKFHCFFEQHAEFYKNAEERMLLIVNQIDTAWLTSFFGKPFQLDNVWIVPANGFNNFSVRYKDKNGRDYYNCAISCYKTDSLGFPFFDASDLCVLIHEICHNYVNPICDKYWDNFKPTCDSIFRYVNETLEKNLYGSSKSLYFESINRLCENAYLNSHHIMAEKRMKLNLIRTHLSGLIWMDDMIDYLSVLTDKKNKYPHFEDYMPQLLGFMQQIPQNMEDYYLPKQKLLRPCVKYTYPAQNSIVDVNLDAITIVFSHQMQTGVKFVGSIEEDTTLHHIKAGTPYWADEYTYIVPLNEPLLNHTKYGFRVSDFPANTFGIRTKPYDLIFETK